MFIDAAGIETNIFLQEMLVNKNMIVDTIPSYEQEKCAKPQLYYLIRV
jgi:hypothetical protein